jgi:NADPH-dependent ferric siderophore reductase
MSKTDKLPTKKRRAIAALLVTPSVKSAAQVAEISERTLHRWLKDTGFQAALAEAEAEAVAQAARQMAGGANEAVIALRQVLRNPAATPREKIAAASAYLSHLPKIRLLGSIEQALERLQRG